MKKLIILFFLYPLIFACTDKDTYYVSTKGSDQNIGSKKEPYASLEKALNTIRADREKGKKTPVEICIVGGTYSILNSILFDENLSNITVRPLNNESVIFTGGVSIPLSLIEKEGEHRYRIDLKKAGITDYGKLRNVGFARPYGPSWGELFVNKKPMHLSRWPNTGKIPLGKVLETGSIPRNDDFSNKPGLIQYDSLRIDKWAKEKEVWMSGYFKLGYADDMVKIAEIDTINKTLKTASTTLYGYGNGKAWNQWYGVNILTELDADGEYYIDREKGILYFVSEAESIESLDFSILKSPFITLENTKNVSINGISFEYSRGLGISMVNTEKVSIANCIFRNLGSLGVTVGKGIEPFVDFVYEEASIPKSNIIGSYQQYYYQNTTFNREGGKNNTITGCEFYQLGAGGVSIGGGNRLTLESGNNLIENSVFYDINRLEKSYRPAVHVTGVGNLIRHCEIYNTPSMAVYMYGNNHLVEYNYLHEVCLEVDDQGAIYYGRDPSELGNVVRYNYFENIPDHHRTCAVYLDDGAGGMTVMGNVFYKAGYWNSLLGGGSNNSYSNNIFIGNKFGIHVDNRMQNWAKWQLDKDGIFETRLKAVNYQNPPYSVEYPQLIGYFDKNPALPKENLIEKNVFVQVKTLLHGELVWLDYKESNWETNSDPGFVDMENKDFRLKKDAVLFKKIKGFKSIPFEKIGTYNNIE